MRAVLPVTRLPIFLLFASLLAGCAGSGAARPELPLVPQVDLQRFTGDWYVIAHIPTWFERDAYNAIENYQLDPEGRMQTTYRQRKGGFDGRLQVYHPTGFVRPGSNNALWGMQFVWPIKAEYRIVGLADDISWTLIGRSARDYVWLMARSPDMDETQFQQLQARITALGYEPQQLRRVPQRWPEPL